MVPVDAAKRQPEEFFCSSVTGSICSSISRSAVASTPSAFFSAASGALGRKRGSGSARQRRGSARERARGGPTTAPDASASFTISSETPGRSRISSRRRSASSWSSWRWPSGDKFAKAMPVTSAWMPIKYQSSSPVSGSSATVRPRRSRRFRNISPDFRRLFRIPTKASPVVQAALRAAISAGSSSLPSLLRKRQFMPMISALA
mmetsp:Transcript_72415/g.155028  ORF Transcript_72415/g.155028 Transcript_72415/m.155028 type:complete len:204 (+) Transcript_72415:210-821(+)